MADDTSVTRARWSLPPVLMLVLFCVLAASARAADEVVTYGMKAPNGIDAVDAWGLSTGVGVDVAVVDTGVNAQHEDLLGQVLGASADNSDGDGHGTAVAGVIAAVRGNHKGVVGVAPDAKIIPIRAFTDASSDPGEPAILDALGDAAATGARVVNASFSSDPATKQDNQAFNALFAQYPDTLFVAAAGNAGDDVDASPEYPCAATAPNLICVGATDTHGALASFSNYGAHSVDLFAPGQSIYTLTLSSYFPQDGTSFAAPFVSGEAALLFAAMPGLTADQAKQVILDTVTPGDSLAGKSVTGGRADAFAALQATQVDTDRDGVPDVIDGCPTQSNPTATGCPPPPEVTPTPTPVPTASPTPTPTPTVTPAEKAPEMRSLSASVSRCKAHRSCKRSATVKATPTAAATVSVRVERHVCAHGRCSWKSVLRKAVIAGTSGVKLTVRGSSRTGLAKGSYRVIAVPSSRAGTGRSVTRTFKVR
jgi:thermitase